MEKPGNSQRFAAIAGLGEISRRYDAILCDIWGVLHNGRAAFPLASEALIAFRRKGGVVVLITNAPRPSAPIREQALRLGVAPLAFDAIVTSGDVTIDLIAERIDRSLRFIGPSRDLVVLEAAAERTGRRPRVVPAGEAEYVLCTGLFDDSKETPEDYDAEFSAHVERGLTMVCANPDVVVHRGDDLVYCAGALAQRYEELGGSTLYAGKPHSPIYASAVARAREASQKPLAKERILAVGDAMMTDMAGAAAAGIDALFIADGIHRGETDAASAGETTDMSRLNDLFARHGVWPAAVISSLQP